MLRIPVPTISFFSEEATDKKASQNTLFHESVLIFSGFGKRIQGIIQKFGSAKTQIRNVAHVGDAIPGSGWANT
jgi:hypothetical protein